MRGQVGQQHRCDPGVVVDHLALGEAGLGIEDLVEVGELDLAPADLLALMQAGGRCLSGEQLKDSLYGFGQDVGSNAINVHIHNLRQKLGPSVVETVRGLGYRFGRVAQ